MANYSISANVFCLFAMPSQGKTQREEGKKNYVQKKKNYVQKKKNYVQKKKITSCFGAYQLTDVTEIYAPSNMKTIITWGIVFIYKCA